MKIDTVKLITTMYKKGIKTGEVVKKSGLSRSTISAVRGGKTCTFDTAVKIANALDIPVDELIEGQVVNMVKTSTSDRFEKALTDLLQVINDDIVNVEFDYINEDVIVTYTLGSKVKVNVNGDSDNAVVVDVFEKIF